MDYQEQQSFHPIIYISTLVIVAAVIGGLVLTGGAPTWIAWIYIAGLLVLFNFLWVSTTIDRHILKVRFGLAVPYFRKMIPLSEIEEARIIDYRPIRDGGVLARVWLFTWGGDRRPRGQQHFGGRNLRVAEIRVEWRGFLHIAHG